MWYIYRREPCRFSSRRACDINNLVTQFKSRLWEWEKRIPNMNGATYEWWYFIGYTPLFSWIYGIATLLWSITRRSGQIRNYCSNSKNLSITKPTCMIELCYVCTHFVMNKWFPLIPLTNSSYCNRSIVHFQFHSIKQIVCLDLIQL